MSYMTVTIETDRFKVGLQSHQPIDFEPGDGELNTPEIARTLVMAIRGIQGVGNPIGNDLFMCLIHEAYQWGLIKLPKQEEGESEEIRVLRSMIDICGDKSDQIEACLRNVLPEQAGRHHMMGIVHPVRGRFE